jgi:signal transduction histidine kinase
VDLALLVSVLAATFVSIDARRTLVVVPPDGWVECLVFGSAACAGLARRYPLTALVAAAILDALPYWLPIGGAGYHWALMVAVYMAMARLPARRSGPAVGVVLIVQVTLMAADNSWQWHSMFTVLAALTVCLPAALGIAARARRQAVTALRERAVAAEASRDADARKLLAEDRLRTARDLHDTVAHQIAVMNLHAGVASGALHERPADAERALVTVREAGRAVIESITDLLTGLRSDGMDPDGPVPVLGDYRALVEEFRTLVPGIELTVHDPAPGDGSPISHALYAVTREALTNVYKHGAPDTAVRVDVRLDDDLTDLVVVNRRGAAAVDPSGFGLQGMRERVTAAGGRLDVGERGDEFVVHARIPAPAGAA